MNRITRRAALGLAAALAAGPSLAQGRPPLMLAAASLQDALTACGAAWTRETSKTARFSFASSAALARQIEQGIPADLFASADIDWMDWAQERRLIRPESRVDLLGNGLALVTSRDAAGELTIAPGFGLAAALGDSRLAMPNPASVPAGRYARQALTALGVWDHVSGRVAGVDNVRAALALAARGEARFAIVYLTDARAEPRVRVVGTFPAASHQPIIYPFALTRASTNPDAGALLAFLGGPTARRIFEEQGFSTLGRR